MMSLSNVVLSQDDITKIMDDGLDAVLAVSASDKLATTWAKIKQ